MKLLLYISIKLISEKVIPHSESLPSLFDQRRLHPIDIGPI